MRIIGGHDYYDSGMAWGRDDAVLFLRNGDRCLSLAEAAKVLQIPRAICSGTLLHPKAEKTSLSTWSIAPDHAFQTVTLRGVEHKKQIAAVIFCGKLYNGILQTACTSGGIPNILDRRWIWSAAGLRAYAADHGLGVSEGKSGSTLTWDWDGPNRAQYDVKIETLDEWFAPHALTGEARASLISERITIASYNPSISPPRDANRQQRPWFIDQPTLGDMDFAKAIDPFSAFQEIAMWKGGVLPSDGPPLVEIVDDKIKIAKHGFDPRSSFRRDKQSPGQ